MKTDPESNSSNDQASPTNGGGVFIAIGTIAGAVIGGLMGQPSIGLLAGLVVGALAACALWLKDR